MDTATEAGEDKETRERWILIHRRECSIEYAKKLFPTGATVEQLLEAAAKIEDFLENGGKK